MMNKILVIEDENSVRTSIRDLLEGNGYQVFTASDGEEGMKLIPHIHPDLIICDVMMPGMNGYDVCRKLNSDNSLAPVPFIFLTAKTNMTDLRIGMESGADDYLIKPFKAAGLLKAVEVRLQRHNAIRKAVNFQMENNIDKTGERLQYDSRFMVTINNKPKFVKVSNIICVVAESEYSTVQLAGTEKFLIRKLLKEWELILPEKIFIRIHRSYIINLNYVIKIEKWFNRSYRIHLKDFDEPLPISQRYYSKIRSRISI